MTEVHRRVTHPEGGRLMTKQAGKDAADINLIMKKYIAHGVPPLANGRTPHYGDFTDADGYMSAMMAIRQAEGDFMRLPSRVRAHVDNDPAKFIEMVFDPERRAELEELGLVAEAAPAAAPPSKPPDPDPEPEPSPAPVAGGE